MHRDILRAIDTSVEQTERGSSLQTDHILASTKHSSDRQTPEVVKKGGVLTERREIMAAVQELSQQILGGKKVQTEMLSDHTNQDREKLRQGLRSIVEKNRQEGNSRSTAPALRSMTESQILLEFLNKPNWPKSLQERNIEVNKRTLELITQMLKKINSPDLPSYNTAIRIFNCTLNHFNIKDVLELQVELAGLRGGIDYSYDEGTNRYYGHIITLTDYKGRIHRFEKGEDVTDITTYIAHLVEDDRNQYAQRYVLYWEQKGHRISDQQIENLKDQYEGKALSEDEVQQLLERKMLYGWTCTELRHFHLPESIYYTDMGTPIYALDFSGYANRTRQDHEFYYPSYEILENPTSRYNCYGSVFTNRQAWLNHTERGNDESETQIRTILRENRYRRVDNVYAQIGDIVAYRKQDRSISHTAIVAHIDPGQILVDSKMGEWGLMRHDINDDMARYSYGIPTIYRTTRENGNLLRTFPPNA